MDSMPLPRPSEIRASDAERERVVTFLRDHALAGRLDSDELEERIGLAYSARYVGDLERLIRDLPRADAPARSRRPAPPRARRSRRHQPTPALIIAGMALLLITGLPMVIMAGIIAVFAVVLGLSFLLGPFLLVALIIVLAGRRRRPPPAVRWGRVA
jgi:hypothetical protein